ncbi:MULTISPECIES: hypothetical protein [Vibrio]|uniref:Uncharacterized protein n=2 Tax=Vibrio alginolyticus TaxID=663 RepID=A0A7Y0MX72_VIBAL|nr:MULTISPECIES: hypothetical protein [Vibrio]AGV19494.1 hypothetical protein N646_3685 [Vibrio alginolyticus NBRC 15630 = ATCC 17749]AVF69013.1 hypothetical protein AL545_07765 [Vibrio alginolyticus]EGQ8017672.1 hypothetical protein [Vibrio alginolyticus]EGQ9572593.1 hypothetical protein [Vibrio alginolyticus]EKK7176535.1 hypothetical protein [Vibrio alginolyticus]
MKKLIALVLMICSTNVAFAGDGSYTGTIDMTMATKNQVDVERADSQLTLKGRNEMAYGGVTIHSDAATQKIELRGRRD